MPASDEYVLVGSKVDADAIAVVGKRLLLLLSSEPAAALASTKKQGTTHGVFDDEKKADRIVSDGDEATKPAPASAGEPPMPDVVVRSSEQVAEQAKPASVAAAGRGTARESQGSQGRESDREETGLFESLARELMIRWKARPLIGLFDAVVASILVGWHVRPYESMRIRHAVIATGACALFVPQGLCGLVGLVTWTFIIKAVKEACVSGFTAALKSDRFVKICLYLAFGAVWVVASIMVIVAWVLMGRDEVVTYHVVALLELPVVMAVLHVGWYAFPERAREMRRHAESASIAFARLLYDTVCDEIQRSSADKDSAPGASAVVGARNLWDPRYSAAVRHWGQVAWRILSKVLKQACVSSFYAAKDSDFLLNAWMYGTICAAMIPGAVKMLEEVSRPLDLDESVHFAWIVLDLLFLVFLVCLPHREQVHSTCCNVRSALFTAVCFVYEKLLEGAGEAYEEWKAQGTAHKD